MGFKAPPADAPVYTPPNLSPKLDWLSSNLPSGTWAKLGVVPTASTCYFHPPVGDKALFTPLANIGTGVRQLQLLDFSHLTLAVLPANCGFSMPTVVVGGRYIYFPQGFSAALTRGANFYRYDLFLDAWAAMAAISTLSSGYRFNSTMGLLWDGGDYIYAIGGYDGTLDQALFRYSISGDSWAELADAPEALYPTAMCAGPIGDYIYALKGGSSTTFYRYSISLNSWATRAVYPGNSGEGAMYEDPDDADLLYAVTYQVAGARTSRYSLLGDAWTALTNTNQPAAVICKGVFYPSPFRLILGVQYDSTTMWVYKV